VAYHGRPVPRSTSCGDSVHPAGNSGLCHNSEVPAKAKVKFSRYVTKKSRDSSVGIATDYGLDDRGLNPGGSWEFFSSIPCPDRLWGPHSLLSNR
jgi:hypothetical protein